MAHPYRRIGCIVALAALAVIVATAVILWWAGRDEVLVEVSWFSGNWNARCWALANWMVFWVMLQVRLFERVLAEGAHCRPSALPG